MAGKVRRREFRLVEAGSGRLGAARYGKARFGRVWQAWRAMARMVWAAWSGRRVMVSFCPVWSGGASPGRQGLLRLVMARSVTVRHGSHGEFGSGMARFGGPRCVEAGMVSFVVSRRGRSRQVCQGVFRLGRVRRGKVRQAS